MKERAVVLALALMVGVVLPLVTHWILRWALPGIEVVESRPRRPAAIEPVIEPNTWALLETEPYPPLDQRAEGLDPKVP